MAGRGQSHHHHYPFLRSNPTPAPNSSIPYSQTNPPPSHPRVPHPAVARITPMVPDASLYFGNTPQPGSYVTGPSAGPGSGSQHPAYQVAGSSTVGSPLPPPRPTNNILQGIAKPSPEFSRNFDSFSLYEPRMVSNPGYDSPVHNDPGYDSRVHNELRSDSFLPETNNNNVSRKDRVRFVDFVQPMTSLSPPQRLPPQNPTDNVNVVDQRARNDPATSGQNVGDSPVPPEILKVLNWQNDQLKLLQEQVQALLQASPQHNQTVKSPPPAQDHFAPVSNLNQKVFDDKSVQSNTMPQTTSENSHGGAQNLQQTATGPSIADKNPVGNVLGGVGSSQSSSNSRSVSTNTSFLWPQIQEGLKKLTEAINEEEEEKEESENEPSASEIRESRIKVNNSDNESVRSPNSMHIDLPDYPASEGGSPDLKKQATSASGTSWESPVLGESVSMYEEEQIQEVYNDILSKVNKLLTEPDPHSGARQNANLSKEPEIPMTKMASASPEDSVAVATCNRLRQLGVSFINPEDLAANLPETSSAVLKTSQPRANEVSALFLPRAVLPSSSVWEGTHSPDTSLQISSLALKYLDEEQLSKLAAIHQGTTATARKSASTLETTYNSTTEVNMSLATHQFLARYGLNDPGTDHAPVGSPSLKTGRKPLTPLHHNNQMTAMTAGVKQNLELRREVLRPGTTKENRTPPQYFGELYRIEEYQNVQVAAPPGQAVVTPLTSQGHHAPGQAATPLSSQGHHAPARNIRPATGKPETKGKPEVRNRILDITAIKSQPKLL